MKFIHVADVHLGATPDRGKPWSVERTEEIGGTFDRLLDLAEEQYIDLLLVAGDLFHRQPLRRELKELNYRFENLSHTRVFIIAGNHDWLKADSYYRDFQWADNVRFFKTGQVSYVYEEDLNVVVYGMSYDSQEITRPVFDNLRPITTIGDGIALPSDCTHILLAHGGDERHIPINRDRLRGAGFDYIALGHIHKPEQIVDHLMAYSGSLEPTDKNDVGPRGYILGQVDDMGVYTEFVSFSARRYVDLPVKVTPESTNGLIMDTVKTAIEQQGSHHIYKIKLTGFRHMDLVIDKEAIEHLGNIVSLEDATLPDFDFQQLYIDNKDNIIGMYIKKITELDVDEGLKAKALCYGLTALYRPMRG